jgi:hypothetical protein
MTPDVRNPTTLNADEAATRAAQRKRAQTGEASSGLWQRVTFQRAIAEGVVIYALWRLLELVPITFWPPALFPFILLGLLVLRFLPPVWASLRVIATRREKMSRRFFTLAAILASLCALTDAGISLAVGDAAQPFGGPTFGPDIARFFATHHHLGLGTFFVGQLANYGLLLGYFLIATICTRLAQGGFLRFTMPSGNGRVTL